MTMLLRLLIALSITGLMGAFLAVLASPVMACEEDAQPDTDCAEVFPGQQDKASVPLPGRQGVGEQHAPVVKSISQTRKHVSTHLAVAPQAAPAAPQAILAIPAGPVQVYVPPPGWGHKGMPPGWSPTHTHAFEGER